MSAEKLKGKKAIITGGGSGIGAGISKLFAAEGAFVVILDYNAENAAQILQEIEAEGGKGLAAACDVSRGEDVEKAVGEIAGTHKIDILVNNAGVSHIGSLESTSEADFDRIYGVNVKGVYNVLHAVLPLMKEAGGGVVLNMASIAGSRGIPNRFAYSMSKGAVLAMTRSVAMDYLEANIRCNSISPARVHTPFVDNFLAKNYPGKEKDMFDKLSKAQPIGRMGTPAEVAALALFLCSEDAAFITGCDYYLDGGFMNITP